MLELQNKQDPGPQILGFGKYADKNIRVAEAMVKDPGYVYWAYYSGALRRYDPWLEFQAWEIIQKAAHIRPPRPRPNNCKIARNIDPTRKV